MSARDPYIEALRACENRAQRLIVMEWWARTEIERRARR